MIDNQVINRLEHQLFNKGKGRVVSVAREDLSCLLNHFHRLDEQIAIRHRKKEEGLKECDECGEFKDQDCFAPNWCICYECHSKIVYENEMLLDLSQFASLEYQCEVCKQYHYLDEFESQFMVCRSCMKDSDIKETH